MPFFLTIMSTNCRYKALLYYVVVQEALCMKKIVSGIIAGLMMTATVSQASPNHHHYGPRHHGHHGGYGWVAPLVIGSAVGYVIATRPIPQPQPIVIQQYPNPPIGYKYEQILDANCNCYRLVLVPN